VRPFEEFGMPAAPDLEDLTRMTPAQLREHWAALGLGGDAPEIKQALIRGLAWHQQQTVRGGLDAQTRRLLRSAVQRAPLPGPRATPLPSRTRRGGVRLRAGTTLVRTWRGRAHEVTVLDDGRFRYRDTEFASLSEIARVITGARWSGPRFFGLKKLKGST